VREEEGVLTKGRQEGREAERWFGWRPYRVVLTLVLAVFRTPVLPPDAVPYLLRLAERKTAIHALTSVPSHDLRPSPLSSSCAEPSPREPDDATRAWVQSALPVCRALACPAAGGLSQAWHQRGQRGRRQVAKARGGAGTW